MTEYFFKSITRVSRALGTTLNRDEVLQLIVKCATETMKAKGAALFLPADEKNERHEAVAYFGLTKHYAESVAYIVPEGLPVMLKDGYLYYQDAANDPKAYKSDLKKKEGIVSLLSIPALVKGKYIGNLCLYTSEPRTFSHQEIEYLTVLAEQGGMAIEHARLVGEMRNGNRLTLELAAAINASLDLKDILQVLTARVAQALGVKAATIRLLDNDRKTLKLVSSYGLSKKYLNKGPVSAEKGIAEALQGKQVVVQNVVLEEGAQYKNEKVEEEIITILTVPIKTKEEVIGVLRLYSATPREFNKGEIMHVTALASMGGLAIENAGLYLMLKRDMEELKEDAWLHRSWL